MCVVNKGLFNIRAFGGYELTYILGLKQIVQVVKSAIVHKDAFTMPVCNWGDWWLQDYINRNFELSLLTVHCRMSLPSRQTYCDTTHYFQLVVILNLYSYLI